MTTEGRSVFDEAEAGLAVVRSAQRRFYRRMAISFSLLFVLFIATAWGNDYASCLRHDHLVTPLNAESRNLAQAVLAGITRSAREVGPELLIADLSYAARNATFAPLLRTKTIDCLQPVPGT